MNIIQAGLRMALRCLTRNKLLAILLGVSGLAAVLAIVLWRNSLYLEKGIHRDLDSLRGNLHNMASTLQDIKSRMSSPGNEGGHGISKPIYWLDAATESRLDRVVTVLERVGFQRGDSDSDWTIAWSLGYTFVKYRNKFLHLKPYQKVNHLPGNGVFASKIDLANTLKGESFHPRSFVLPKGREAFEEAVKQSPEMLWVVKGSTHRRIKIVRGKEVPMDLTGSFVQEFLDKPFLIGGRKFDIGVYVVIAGVDPLRAYVYEEELLLRFCAKDYNPLNISDVHQYVVTDDYSPIWETPIIREKYSDLKLSARDSFITHMTDHGHGTEVKRIMQEMKEIIRSVLQRSEAQVLKTVKTYGNPKHFFELVRFDFFLDSGLKVWLMEINMSPNLDPSHFPPNVVLYEQVIFNTLSLIGVIRSGGFNYNGEFESIMLVRDKDIHIPLTECYNGDCKDCARSICSLCSHCLSERDEYILKQAFLEHLGRRNFARVVPPPIEDRSSLASVEAPGDAQLSPSNRLLTQWTRGKCLQHTTWCS